MANVFLVMNMQSYNNYSHIHHIPGKGIRNMGVLPWLSREPWLNNCYGYLSSYVALHLEYIHFILWNSFFFMQPSISVAAVMVDKLDIFVYCTKFLIIILCCQPCMHVQYTQTCQWAMIEILIATMWPVTQQQQSQTDDQLELHWIYKSCYSDIAIVTLCHAWVM